MAVSLVASQTDTTARLTVTLDDASAGPVELFISSQVLLSGATLAGINQIASGNTEVTSGQSGETAGIGVVGDFPGPLAAGAALFALDFDITGPGRIQVAEFVVLINEMSGSNSEAGDLITLTFGGAAVEATTDGPDLLTGTPGNDAIRALGGDDIFVESGGVDVLDGGAGLDTLQLEGARADYLLTLTPQQTTFQDKDAAGDAAPNLIEIRDIERVTFEGAAANDAIDLTKFGGAATLEPAAFNSIIELYIAYFNRAPDALGLNFWATAFADGMPIEEVARQFSTQPETMLAYPEGTSNADFLTTIYANVLGRTPDTGGFTFWLEELEAERVTRDFAILEVLKGARAVDLSQPQVIVDQQLADQSYLDSKTDVGAFYAVHTGLSDVDGARSVMQSFGTAAVADEVAARNVTADLAEVAAAPETAAFIMSIVGVVVDDFSGLI
ncbi:MAG: DUF4214 domain-containing protein [Pseudomonadota bacterium]